MKALFFRQHGDFKNIEFGDVPEPQPAEDEVLVRVRACALNHLDLWVLEGWPGLQLLMPHIGGADITGEIASVGRRVFGWTAGARVAVNPGYCAGEDEWTKRGEDSVSPLYRIFGESRPGGNAEFVTVPANCLIPLPDHISFSHGAAPLLVSLTAWRMLVHRAKLKKGETVLVVGAGGGVNSMSIQLARVLGATVIALTSSEDKKKRALALGASEVINYRDMPDWSREVRRITKHRGVDVVIDNVGATTFEQSLRAVARGGRIVTVGNTSGPVVTFDNRLMFTKQISLLGSTMGSAEDFKKVTQHIWDGSLKPVIDCELPLSAGRSAYERLERGEQFGKIVLLP